MSSTDTFQRLSDADFTLQIIDAGGAKSLQLFNNKTNLGKRILGDKAFYEKKVLAEFNIDKDVLLTMINDCLKVIENDK